MRKILFRGKRKDNGEWVEGILFDNEVIVPQNQEILIFENRLGSNIRCHLVFPETVGQYTGLTDKNGKKIFEGDIFRIEDDMVAVVIFDEGCFRFQVYGQIGTFAESGYDECGGGYGIIECEPIDWYCVKDMQIIGNVHNNPELLGV